MAELDYKTRGVCARSIHVETADDGTIQDVKFAGGCDGNLRAISRLVVGKDKNEVADLLEGNTCGMKSTSCADQLAKALREM